VSELSKEAKELDRLAFIGLGAMGFGMTTNLVKKGFSVRGYDVSQDPNLVDDTNPHINSK
jgi:3-hydroxyisobutyrate dehydrogenase-like beta-hydroxyacid dehydrogenase